MKRSVTARTAALAAIAAALLSACSSEAEPAAQGTVGAPPPVVTRVTAPATTTVTVAAPTATAEPSAAPAGDCATNPVSAPAIAVEPYGTVAEEGRISVTLTGIPSGIISPGGAPVEVEVNLCNDSALDYPAVGVVLVFGHCSCAANPMSIPSGTVERFDDAGGDWIATAHPTAGTGMDYLGGYETVVQLPKGEAVTVRYRVALDASMTAGEGALEGVAVTPEPLNRLGSADLPFAVTG
jgi:hypothetical protein